jgi:predicted transposase/invertase (TIGR01784 family)
VKTDSLFYRLFQTAPVIFFELIGQAAQAQDYVFRSVELKQTAFRIDGVFLPTQNPMTQTVYFLEVQFQRDEQLYRRLFAEIFLFLRQNSETARWQAVIVYPTRSQAPQEIQPYELLLSSPQVQQIYLDELGQIENLSVEIGLLRLIVEPEDQTAERAQQLLDQVRQFSSSGLSQAEIIELIETIVVYKFPQMSRQEIEAMFELSELKQTRVYQEAKAEGRAEGQTEGERSLVIRLLTRKIGEVPVTLLDEVRALSIEKLEALAEALLDFSTVTDLKTWLNIHAVD